MMIKKIKSVIIDDEPGNIETLKILLGRYCSDVFVAETFIDPAKAISGIERISPDLVFLDIEMPYYNAFDLLDNLGEINFEVVFVTAFNNYALKAIKYAAIDYLLKPVNIDELVKSVERAKRQVMLRRQEENIRVKGLLQNLKQTDEASRKLTLATLTGFEVEESGKILYFEADGTYSKIFLTNGRVKVVAKSLKEFEEVLSSGDFIRVHHSYLVNAKHVVKYKKGRGGKLVMFNGHEVEVSVRRKHEVLARFGY